MLACARPNDTVIEWTGGIDGARLLGVMKDGVFHKDPQKGPARGRFSRSAA